MYHCIVNPSARSGKGKDIWKKLELKFHEKGIDYTAYMTKGPGDGTVLAQNITASNTDTKIVVLGCKRPLLSSEYRYSFGCNP